MKPAEEIRAEVEALGPWFHNLHLGEGIQTAPEHWLGDFPSFKWKTIEPHLPASMHGWEVLDIGCNAGFYSIEMARRGAKVTGFDCDPHYLRQAEWAVNLLGLQEQITLRQGQVYDLAQWDRQFDLVLFMGVLYHLRYPMLGLDIVARLVRGTLLFQTLTLPGEEVYLTPENVDFHEREVLQQQSWPRMAFIEKQFAGDYTNWWVPNRAANEAMLRSAGMEPYARLEEEIYLCRPDGRPWTWRNPGNPTEFEVATRQATPPAAQCNNRPQ